MFPNNQVPYGVPGRSRAQSFAQNAVYSGENPSPDARGVAQAVADRTAAYANAAAGVSSLGAILALIVMAIVAVSIAWKQGR